MSNISMYNKSIKINFSKKKIIITGGSRGIGKKIAQDFKKLGAQVISISTKNYDLSKSEDLKRLITYIRSLNKIDILVNNAGINFSEINRNFSEEKFNDLININLKAAFILTKEVSKKMIKNKFGRIINIASIASERVVKGRSVYATSKFGLIGFTKTVSAELARYNILVNAVSPGFIDTEMTRTMLTKAEIKKLLSQVPMNKLGSSSDISNAVIFLCSELNTFITGHNLVVDGGFLGSVSV